MKINIAPPSMQQLSILEFFEFGRLSEAFNQSYVSRRALLLQPGLDLVRMRRAIQTIIERHESLRMRFVYENNSWGVVTDNARNDVFVVEDIGPVDGVRLEQLVSNCVAPALNPFTGPMLEIRILRLGKHGDALLVRGHQIVLDGWSLAIVLGEVFQGYLGIPLGPASAMNHRRFIREFNGDGNREILAEREAYFSKLLLPPVPLPKLGRTNRGLQPNVNEVDVNPGAECTVSISRDSRRRLLERAKAAGVTDLAMFLASYAMTIGCMGDVDEVQINVPAANRRSRELLNYVGWVSALMPTRCTLPRSGNVEDLARDLYKQYLKSFAYLPVEFAAFNKFGSIRQQQVDAGAYPGQFVGGMLVPEGILKAVPVASILLARGDEVMDFGVTKITILSVPAAPLNSELELWTYDTGKDFRYIATYDQTAFSGAEVAEIIQQTFDRLVT